MDNVVPKKIIFLIIGIILVLFLALVAFFWNQSQQNPQSLEPQITRTIPNEATFLRVNELPTFVIEFNQLKSLDDIEIRLSKKEIQTDKGGDLNFKTSFDLNNQTLTISGEELVSPLTEYQIEIKNKKTNQLIDSLIFMSTEPIATPVPSNNQSLERFLPIETGSYKLSFNPDLNIYSFSFKYDPNSSETAEEQFNKARDEATRFIQSKGIDINSIVIEWRYN